MGYSLSSLKRFRVTLEVPLRGIQGCIGVMWGHMSFRDKGLGFPKHWGRVLGVPIIRIIVLKPQMVNGTTILCLCSGTL